MGINYAHNAENILCSINHYLCYKDVKLDGGDA